MFTQIIQLLVNLLGVYVGIGLLFGLYFVTKGVGKIDPDAREGTWGFRLIILPGVVALWPILLVRLFRGLSEPPMERTPHKIQARRSWDANQQQSEKAS